MTRKIFIGSFNNNHTVFETVRGGCRAVSKTFFSKEEAQAALQKLQEGQK
jgi:hypothetical protein